MDWLSSGQKDSGRGRGKPSQKSSSTLFTPLWVSLHVRGTCSRVLVMDVANTDGMEKYVSEAIGLFGHVDMLVNNAGVAQRGLYSQFTLDTQRRLFEVDFFGQITLTKALLPRE